jgi:3-phenylpropionate/trans-cinnamate dioxygenase ferredoxin reductase subunit
VSDRTVFLVNPASANGGTGKRWPELATRAAHLGLTGDMLFSERPGHLIELAATTDADLVVAGVGVQPNVELAQAAGLEVRDGVVVNERFETSKPGVYAVGDVAEFYDPIYGRHRRIEHWSNAAYHGTTLGKILAGDDARYDVVSSFFSEQFGRSFKSFGLPDGHDETTLDGDFHDDRAVLRFLRAIGAVTKGLDEDAENALKEEIREGAAAATSAG